MRVEPARLGLSGDFAESLGGPPSGWPKPWIAGHNGFVSTLDLEPYARGNRGVPYAVTFESGHAGPSVLVTALVHGNEVCGGLALDTMLKRRIRPLRGRLTLAFGNPLAFQGRQGSPVRYIDEDLNRLWSPGLLDGPQDSYELARARELRPLLDDADLLLDLHSVPVAGEFPPLVLCGTTARARELALAIGVPRYVVCDSGHTGGKRMRDYGGFGDESSAKTALLVECGVNRTPESAQVALDVTLRSLLHLGMVDEGFAGPYLTAPAVARQQVVAVTEAIASSDQFRFAAPFRSMEIIADAGTPIAYDGERVIRAPYDRCVLIMPVSSLQRGQTAVRLGKLVAA
jgi:predicted deacylase